MNNSNKSLKSNELYIINVKEIKQKIKVLDIKTKKLWTKNINNLDKNYTITINQELLDLKKMIIYKIKYESNNEKILNKCLNIIKIIQNKVEDKLKLIELSKNLYKEDISNENYNLLLEESTIDNISINIYDKKNKKLEISNINNNVKNLNNNQIENLIPLKNNYNIKINKIIINEKKKLNNNWHKSLKWFIFLLLIIICWITLIYFNKNLFSKIICNKIHLFCINK